MIKLEKVKIEIIRRPLCEAKTLLFIIVRAETSVFYIQNALRHFEFLSSKASNAPLI